MKQKAKFNRIILAGALLALMGCFASAYWFWTIWQAQQQAAQFQQAIQTQVDTLLQQHHPDGLWLIGQLKTLPLKVQLDADSTIEWKAVDPVAVYVSRPELESVLFDLGTLLHEGSHIYHSRAGLVKAVSQQLHTHEKQDFFNYWLNPKTQFLVRADSVFPAREIAALLPKAVHTDRLSEYITTSDSAMATQSSGLYGLIDEWVAYYQGLRTEVALLKVVSTQSVMLPESERRAWLAFASRMSSGYLAYFEFKLYLLAYLYHAQTQHPQIYQTLLANPMLKQVLAEVNQAYQTMLPQYLRLRMQYVAGQSAQSQAFIADLQAKQQQLEAEINKPIYLSLRQQFMLEGLKR
ncbi:MAG: hypothetical protein CVV27_01040 [Candidatus Melainabacteria bacterium HGW-Melainabacteria-1]|nr:MAG: hypothetical protein CVV27_01040 [Candidatus Melainabacteria bacterium HGW-Melainabacteria-1]